jgi:MarR family 2-MHQ and catechol resistance regulon transcriptional repressor
MTVNYESEKLVLRLWLLLHRVSDLLKTGEDRVLGEYNLTTEQFSVLVTIKYLGESARPTVIARWLARSPNSVSMIVDRMVKAGLVKRVRDRSDRRVVNVFITSKGESALKPGTQAAWKFIQEFPSPLPYESRHTLVSLLETVKHQALEYINPGVDIETIMKNEAECHANLLEQLIRYISPSTSEAKGQGKKKGKTI